MLARLIFLVVICTLAASIGCSSGQVSKSSDDEKGEVVRDRLWLWAQVAGAFNDPYLRCLLPKKSSIEPAAAAEYLGIRNLLMVTYKGRPAPPFDEYHKQFEKMDKVVWSLTGACGATSEKERKSALELAEKNPNISGFVLDDFFCGGALPPPPVLWLAHVNVKFPVTLTVTPPAEVACDKLELTQSDWPEGSYRTKDFAVDISPDGKTWQEVSAATMPNKPAEKLAVKLPGNKFAALRIRILSTHDTKGGMSCGLKRIRLWAKDSAVDIAKWQIKASSAYGPFKPESLLVDENDMPLPAVLTPQQVAEIHKKMVVRGKKLQLSAVMYTENISPRAIHHLKHVDEILLWTWRPPDLEKLEQNFVRLEKLNTGKKILLGCYLYDFEYQRPIPLELMKKQAKLGLKWLHEGRIEGIIFLGNSVCDVDLPAVEWTRKWISEVADQELAGTGK